MVLTSINFIIFFLILFIVYYFLPFKIRWIILLIASLFFYVLASGRYIGYILFTSITTYVLAIIIEKINFDLEDVSGHNSIIKKLVCCIALVSNIGILSFLKYYNFLSVNIESVMERIGLNIDFPSLKLFLPLGISFYTFITIGYIIDIYRGMYKTEKNYFKYLLYVIYFPHITQGPIGRINKLRDEIEKEHYFSIENIKFGMQLMLWGYLKKLLIADQLAIIVDNVFQNYQNYNAIQYIVAIIAYAIQIYTDFSGCMDIVRGVSQVFGIELDKNFETPYFSKSIPEFWRRWHITLGAWFRDYLFYPVIRSNFSNNIMKLFEKLIGRKKSKKVPTYLALIIVWLTTGLWHGASWHYVFWGGYYGILIIASTMFKSYSKKMSIKLHINTECESFQLFRIIRTFTLVCIGYIFFRADNLRVAFSMIKSILTANYMELLLNCNILGLGLSASRLLAVITGVAILFIVSLLQQRYSLRKKLAEQNMLFRWLIYWSGILITYFAFLLQNGGFGSTVKFIYMQF